MRLILSNNLLTADAVHGEVFADTPVLRVLDLSQNPLGSWSERLLKFVIVVCLCRVIS